MFVAIICSYLLSKHATDDHKSLCILKNSCSPPSMNDVIFLYRLKIDIISKIAANRLKYAVNFLRIIGVTSGRSKIKL